MSVQMAGVCPVHGAVFRFTWSGEGYVLGTCAAILADESKAAGELVRCGEQLKPERVIDLPDQRGTGGGVTP